MEDPTITERFADLWLRPTDPRRYALLRICFALVMVVQVCHLLPYSASLLSDRGLLPRSYSSGEWPWAFLSLFVLCKTPLLVALFLLLTAAAAVSLALGRYSRICSAFLFWFCLSLVQRIPNATTGWDMILSNIALLVLISPQAPEWTPQRLWRERSASLTPADSTNSTGHPPRYGLVLMQLQVAVIYWQTVLGKLLDTYWANGEFLSYFMLSHHSRFPGTWAIEQQGLLATATYATLAIELFLPLMLWVRGLRKLGLLVGIGFHLSIAALTINLGMFSLIMIFTYVAFIHPWEPERTPESPD